MFDRLTRFAAVSVNIMVTATLMISTGSMSGILAQPKQGNPNPGVLPPNSRPQGHTYGDWSAAWWKWALEKTAAESPLQDPTGANCAIGQTGSVWFLAGTFGVSTPVTRSCTVRPGVMLFFPVANAFCSAEGTFEEMQACAKAFMDSATNLAAEIDGVPVQHLGLYRTDSPDFTLVLPDGNIFGAPAGEYRPSASDGIFLMLTPLKPGNHTIRFRADFPDSLVDVIFHITVGK
jgi:hypothetical protein